MKGWVLSCSAVGLRDLLEFLAKLSDQLSIFKSYSQGHRATWTKLTFVELHEVSLENNLLDIYNWYSMIKKFTLINIQFWSLKLIHNLQCFEGPHRSAFHRLHAAFFSRPGPIFFGRVLLYKGVHNIPERLKNVSDANKLQDFNDRAKLKYQFDCLFCSFQEIPFFLALAFFYRYRKGLAAVEQEIGCSSLNWSIWYLTDSCVIKAIPGLGHWVLAKSSVVATIQVTEVVLGEEGMSDLVFTCK